MEDHYEINIAKRESSGYTYSDVRHWGRVIISTYDEKEAVEKLEYLRKLFGDEFKVSMTYWTCRGEAKPEWN